MRYGRRITMAQGFSGGWLHRAISQGRPTSSPPGNHRHRERGIQTGTILTVCKLDNSTMATTGHQPHPVLATQPAMGLGVGK